jgi:predicted nucleic acid-binding protein
METIYLDACCLNRPFDDQTQDRIRLETEAILLIMNHLYRKEFMWIGSEILNFELDQISDLGHRNRVKLLLMYIHEYIKIEQTEIDRAKYLESLGFGSFDALHIACAESGKVDIFLTTDDKLLRKAKRFSGKLYVKVINPLMWLKEIYKW